MNVIRHIAHALRTAKVSPWVALVAGICLWSNAAMAQEVTVHDAVISIPEGVHFSTDGGITLQGNGGIDNDGTLALKGDWTNDGRGLLAEGKGTVVMEGKDQAIRGKQATTFGNLVLRGQGEKELAASVTVSGQLTMKDCAVITHGFAFIQLGDPKLRVLENAIVLVEKVRSVQTNIAQITAAHSPASHSLGDLQGLGIVATSPVFRWNGPSDASAQMEGKTNWKLRGSQSYRSVSCGADFIEISASGLTAALLTMYHSGATINNSSFFGSNTLVAALGCELGGNASQGQARQLNLDSASAFAVFTTHLTGSFYTA